MAKRFFYVCAGLFLLALTYHLGARRAGAQAPGNPAVATGPVTTSAHYDVVTANGDVYSINLEGGVSSQYRGNIFGAPVQAMPESWGAVKNRYRR